MHGVRGRIGLKMTRGRKALVLPNSSADGYGGLDASKKR